MELFKTLSKVMSFGLSVFGTVFPIVVPLVTPRPTPKSIIEELEQRFAEINKLLKEILEKKRRGELKI